VALAILLKPVFPVMEYAMNYHYISKVLCVNRDKPMLHCNGKCHLMKELAKAAENEKPSSSDKKAPVKHETELLFWVGTTALSLQAPLVSRSNKITDCYSNLYHHLLGTAVDHPPTFS